MATEAIFNLQIYLFIYFNILLEGFGTKIDRWLGILI